MAVPSPITLHESDQAKESLYGPLNNRYSEIRLLKIKRSADFDSAIRCRLQTVSLSEKHTYIALSYVWGDPDIKRKITVNNEDLNVTVNLDIALRYIRMNWKSIIAASGFPDKLDPNHGLLWIDAICINQGDSDEKQQQVEMMRDIYSGAHFVLSWLGESTPQLSLAVSTFRLIEANTPVDLEQDTASSYASDCSWLQRYLHIWEQGVQDQLNEVWLAIEAFFYLPYWTRSWIIQEIVLSEMAILLIGNDLVELSIFHTVRVCMSVILEPHPTLRTHSWYESLHRHVLSASNPAMSVIMLEYLNTLHTKQHSFTLPFILGRLKEGYAATDPRDLIYALLAISHVPIKPDYSKSILDVYTLVALTWVNTISRPTLDFLLYAEGGLHAGDLNWPSWVPDWQARQNKIPLTCGQAVLEGILKYSADCGLTAQKLELEVCPVLHVECVLTEHIVALEDQADNYTCLEDRLFNDAICRYILRSITKSTRPDGFDEHCFTSLYQCLTWESDIMDRDEKTLLMTMLLYNIKIFIKKNDVQDVPVWLQARVEALAPRESLSLKQLRSLFRGQTFLRRIGHTSRGRVATIPPIAAVQDYIGVIPGCSCPVLLRKVDNHFIHLGACFVDGLMNGKAAMMVKYGEVESEGIEIW